MALTAAEVTSYLNRIGIGPQHADAAYLRDLQVAHLHTIPFESLSIQLAEPISLDTADLVRKLVTRRRGGFCYELNGLFGQLLKALGFDVTLLGAAVYGDGRLGPPLDHLVLRVLADSEPWLADVGFGAFAHHPLRWDVRERQADPSGAYRIERAGEAAYRVLAGEDPQYYVEDIPRSLTDFEPTCWWQATSPQSHFTQAPVCSILTPEGRVTIRDRVLIETVNGEQTKRTVADDAELLGLYRDRFGISLDRLPRTLHPV